MFCGCGDVQSEEANQQTAATKARLSQRASVAYTESIKDHADWNPWQRISKSTRSELHPLQMDWLDLANTSMQEIRQSNQAAKNPLAKKTLKRQVYEKQRKLVQELLTRIHTEGLDNWPMTLEDQGLGFAPGLAAYAGSDNAYQAADGYQFQLMLNGDSNDGGLIAKMFASAMSIEQLNDVSTRSVIESEVKDTLYISLPPGSFRIAHLPPPENWFGVRTEYNGNTVIKVDVQSDRGPESAMCYVPYYLHVDDPTQLRITKSRDPQGFKELSKTYQKEMKDQKDAAAKEKQRRIAAAKDTIATEIYELVKRDGSGFSEHTFAHQLGQSFAIHDGYLPSELTLGKSTAARQVLKEFKIPLTELYQDPRVAYVAAAGAVENPYGFNVKYKADYRKKMSKFLVGDDKYLQAKVRYSKVLDRYLIPVDGLNEIKKIVKDGYRPRRPYEQGFVPTKSYVSACEEILKALEKEHKRGHVIIFDDNGQPVAWN